MTSKLSEDFSSKEKILALIDESNLLAAARACNRSLDWLAIKDFLLDETNGGAGEVVVYVGLPPVFVQEFQEQRARKLRFVHWLKTHGFLVVTKDGAPSGDGHYKADVDLLMVIDCLELVQQYKPETVVLVTNDPDFAHLAVTLRRRGYRVEIAALESGLGGDLRGAATNILDLKPLLMRFDSLRQGNDGAPNSPAPRYSEPSSIRDDEDNDEDSDRPRGYQRPTAE